MKLFQLSIFPSSAHFILMSCKFLGLFSNHIGVRTLQRMLSFLLQGLIQNSELQNLIIRLQLMSLLLKYDGRETTILIFLCLIKISDCVSI